LLWRDDTTNHIVIFYVLNYFTLTMDAIADERFWW